MDIHIEDFESTATHQTPLRNTETITIHLLSPSISFHFEMLLHSYPISNLRSFLLFMSILLLLPASTLGRVFTPKGRSVLIQNELSKEERSEEMLMVNSMIGSRPPLCERRCPACSNCEAVQVPATPQESSSSAHSSMITNAKDDNSNYKPMSWKCKCGSSIFNP